MSAKCITAFTTLPHSLLISYSPAVVKFIANCNIMKTNTMYIFDIINNTSRDIRIKKAYKQDWYGTLATNHFHITQHTYRVSYVLCILIIWSG